VLRRPSEQTIVACASLAIYLLLAAVLVFGFHSIVGDAWSRVGNAYYVLFSRDPHLAAVGFVWSPLPSLVMLPLLPFKAVWPALVTHGFAANIVSAVFMAGAVGQIHRILHDLGVVRAPRLILTAAFAANPMVLLYAANGMSEAMFLFFLILTARQLMIWLDQRRVGALAAAGVALAFAYLTRYEAAAAAMSVMLVVGVASWTAASRRERWASMLADLLIVGLPFVAVFLAWAGASWIIVGSPFEIFTSVYGNSAQVGRAAAGIAASTGQGGEGGLGYGLSQIAALSPYLLPLAIAALAGSLLIRDRRVAGPLAVFGGVLVFALLAFLTGRTFGWLRFYIAVLPLTVLLAGILARSSALTPPVTAWMWRGAVHLGQVARFARSVIAGMARGLAVAVTAAACFAALAAVPSAAAGMLDPSIGRGEASEQLSALWPSGDERAVQYSAQAFAAGGAVAAYLDAKALPDGAVVADAATAFPIVLQSARPRQFVITPDRDFQAVLADPRRFDARYLVVPPDYGGHDAINRAYPGIYASGSGIATLVAEFEEGGFRWRVYALRP
jgi:4-amino-4-deoxy-L-arabinose transferase-like glycosyltransferase